MTADSNESNYFKGRGAQINVSNRFLKHALVTEHIEGLDEELLTNSKTEIFIENPKKVLNKIDSPDVGMTNSVNPYQGCEHGCVYCYARNTHNYYGFSAGLDFERKIIVKPNVAAVLRAHFDHKNYQPSTVTFSGNTDCYQPVERHYKLTRSLLELCLEYKNPVGIITKNALIIRDLDLLEELAKLRLLRVMISITSLSEQLRSLLEPRTVSAQKRLQTIEKLSAKNIPVGVMTAPIIPGLNSDEIPEIIKQAADHGATAVGYTLVRLNGDIADIFKDWLDKNMPDAAGKIWNQIRACHGGEVSDSRYGKRMRGDGKIAESIHQLFHIAKKKYMQGREMPAYDFSIFERPLRNGQTKLF